MYMKKVLIGSVILLVVLGGFLGYWYLVRGKTYTKPVTQTTVTKTPPSILLSTGKTLGVDFSDVIFANQTNCYNDPFYFVNDKQTGLRAICYELGKTMTTLFWVRKEMPVTEFVTRNAVATAKSRAVMASSTVEKEKVSFIKEENGISYFDVSIGKNFKNIQSVFFIQTPEADKLGLKVAVMVKASTIEEAKQKIVPLKVILEKKKVSFLETILYSLVEKAYADDGGDGPALSDGSGGTVSDGSGNSVGTGCGSCGGSSGTDPNGTTSGSPGAGTMCLAGSPIIAAGPDLTVNGTSVSLSGTFNGYASVWMYQSPPNTGWMYVSGPNTPTFSGSSFTPTGTFTGTIGSTASGLVPGTYVLRLLVNSSIEPGCWAYDDVTITVTAPMSGTLNASPLTCQIATGASSCQSTLTWATTNPQGTSGITRDGTPGLLFSGNNDSKATNVPYEADGSVTYRLYNNAIELGNVTVSVTCASGKYDTDGKVCADPHVDSAIVGGEYYPPGTITLTCSNSDSYSVTFNGAPFVATTPYTGPVVIPNVTQEGNYTIKCMQGTVVDQVARFYDATPPASAISLSVSPITIGKDGKVTTSWKTKFPSNACTLTAKVVCPNDACTPAQSAFQSSINNVLQTEKTDTSDPETSRLISVAVKTVAPGHINTDWLALGRKTLQIGFTTDLTYDCGGNNKETKRIQVTKSDLQ